MMPVGHWGAGTRGWAEFACACVKAVIGTPQRGLGKTGQDRTGQNRTEQESTRAAAAAASTAVRVSHVHALLGGGNGSGNVKICLPVCEEECLEILSRLFLPLAPSSSQVR